MHVSLMVSLDAGFGDSIVGLLVLALPLGLVVG